MKAIIIIVCFIALQVAVFSQDFEPTQDSMIYMGTKILVSPNSPPFNQDKMLLGWQWGGGWSMTGALGMNQSQVVSRIMQASSEADSINLVMNRG